jgi:hypothetical protein
MLGELLHGTSKKMMRSSVGLLSKTFDPIIKRKMDQGWINPEIEILWDNIGEIIEKEEKAWTRDEQRHRDKHGEKEYVNRDREFWHNLRKILCCLLDEDTYYLLRFFYLIEIFNRDYDKYRIEMHRERAYWNWEEIKAGLMGDMNGIDESKQVEGIRGSSGNDRTVGNSSDADRT